MDKTTKNKGYIIDKSSICIFSKEGICQAELPLKFSYSSQSISITDIENTENGYKCTTNVKDVYLDIIEYDSSLCVTLSGQLGYTESLAYFLGSKVNCSFGEAFIPDNNYKMFSIPGDGENNSPNAEEHLLTISSTNNTKEYLNLKEDLWMISPQPHVIAFSDEKGNGFGFSIPECMPEDYTRFHCIRNNFYISFHGYNPIVNEGKLPAVFIDIGLEAKTDILERHLQHAKMLGLVESTKENFAWWHNPLYCTWGDQCYLAETEGIPIAKSLTPERILNWADKIRSFYDAQVNFIIDDGYFYGFGDYRIKEELYGSIDGFRELIKSLKHMNFKVILWYTPFWVADSSPFITKNPEYFLHNRDGNLLRKSKDSGHYYLDWSNPEVRAHNDEIIRFFLEDLDADGFKIDMNFSHPLMHEIIMQDCNWAHGSRVWFNTLKHIYNKAKSIKKDVFITISGTESYLQPYTSAVRLNDLFDFDKPDAWYKRAELVNRLMPGVAIDVDGWPSSLIKLREYPFVASVFGAPVAYYLEGTEIGRREFGTDEINRIAAVWHTYRNAPCCQNEIVTINSEKDIFERRDSEGKLKACSILKSVFVTYGNTIQLASNKDITVAIPLEAGSKIVKVVKVLKDSIWEEVDVFCKDGKVIMEVEDSAKGILFYELYTDKVS